MLTSRFHGTDIAEIVIRIDAFHLICAPIVRAYITLRYARAYLYVLCEISAYGSPVCLFVTYDTPVILTAGKNGSCFSSISAYASATVGRSRNNVTVIDASCEFNAVSKIAAYIAEPAGTGFLMPVEHIAPVDASAYRTICIRACKNP